jgi:hypothetical protein
LPNDFVDTSALAKVYHQEAGAEFMRRIVADPASRSFVSHLAILNSTRAAYSGQNEILGPEGDKN